MNASLQSITCFCNLCLARLRDRHAAPTAEHDSQPAPVRLVPRPPAPAPAPLRSC